MALIGQIRKNSWILIVMIALGVGGFLLMDIMTSGGAPGGGAGQMVLGEVEGEKIDRQAFERTYGLLYQNSAGNSYANRQQLWNWYVENVLVDEEAEELGLGVGTTELQDLEFGPRPSRIVQQRFSDPQQPGTVNREQLDGIKQIIEQGRIQEEIQAGRLSPQFVEYWRHQREEIIKDRLQGKLTNLVTKAMYTPTWMAEMLAKEQNTFMDFAYVRIPYDEIPNDEVSLTEEDLEQYLKENRALYENPVQTRRLEYVVFSVEATAKDSTAIRNQLAGLVNEFAQAENDSNFVLRNEGIISPAYLSKSELSATAADTILNLAKGQVFGPYIDEGAYKLVKVLDRAVMADSADTRHILITATTPAEFPQAEQRIDSILNVLRSGAASFDSLAMRLSQDPGSASNGGKYENVLPNQFVSEFNEVLFITGVPGQYYKIRTSYGYHIVEVLSRSNNTQERVQVAYLSEPIVPAKETQNAAYDRAAEFVATYRTLEELRQAVQKEPNLSMVVTDPLAENDFMVGELGFGNDTRDMICWAFSAEAGDVSDQVYTFTDDVNYFDNKYVVVGLRNVIAKGLPNVADIRDEIEAAVLNQKKAKMLMERIQGQDLSAIAQQFAVAVDTASNVSFAQPFVTGLGNEPKVIAHAFSLAEGAASTPIEGQSGVFIIKSLRQPTAVEGMPVEQVKMANNASTRAQVTNRLVADLIKEADVSDYRATFDCGT